jgi:hypothetical protein
MDIEFEVYGIGWMVYEVLDEFCAHFFASKHFNCSVHGRLNNESVAQWVETCQREGLYLIMDSERNDVCTVGHYAPIPFKWPARNDAIRAIPATDLNNILVGELAIDRYIQAPSKPLDYGNQSPIPTTNDCLCA